MSPFTLMPAGTTLDIACSSMLLQAVSAGLAGAQCCSAHAQKPSA